MRWMTRQVALMTVVIASVTLPGSAVAQEDQDQLTQEQFDQFTSEDVVITGEVLFVEERPVTDADIQSAEVAGLDTTASAGCFYGEVDRRGELAGVHIFTYRMYLDWCFWGTIADVNDWGGYPVWTAVGFSNSGQWPVSCTNDTFHGWETCQMQVAYTGCFVLCKQNYYSLYLRGDLFGNLYYI